MLESPLSHQLTAWYSGEPVASHMYIVYNRRCTYLHGASSGAHREVMSPYALQWRAIQMARERGDKEFDLWGVAVPAHGSGDVVRTFHHYSWDAHDPWSGITRFKAGFGGSVMSYPEAIEIPLRRAPYILYRAARVFRRRVSLLYARHS